MSSGFAVFAFIDSIKGGICSAKSLVSSFKAPRVAGFVLYERLAWDAVIHCVAVEIARRAQI